MDIRDREYSALCVGWREMQLNGRWCLVAKDININEFSIPGRYCVYELGQMLDQEGLVISEYVKESYNVKKSGYLLIRKPVQFPEKHQSMTIYYGCELKDPGDYPHYVEGKDLVMWRIY